ncbi:MAG TPA: hypothetical protein VGK89_13505 [Candidatus Eisenbacteria bacterium]|jgi:hypothetical protein
MRNGPAFVLLAAACAALAAPAASAGALNGSPLALPLIHDGAKPELVLAQRTITRSWGLSEDSTYAEISLPDWKSEGWAMALSGAVPGAGHAYLGESSGFVFALLEAGGWVARRHFDSRSDRLRESAGVFLGNPADSSAAWSFARWEESGGGDATEMRALYQLDRSTFNERIARDPAYAGGWQVRAIPPRDEFRNFLDRADGMLARKRYATTGIWINHLVAALDALRAARIGNLPLRRNLQLKVKAAGGLGSPSVTACLERRF